MRLILDTDLLTILQQRSQPAYGCLAMRLAEHAADDICATIVSFQEQVQGWMAALNKARSSAQVVFAYERLERIHRYFSTLEVLRFTLDAQDRFMELRKQRVRIGTQDLRIACIALATGSTLLSRNLRDFRQVPDLQVEDWTV